MTAPLTSGTDFSTEEKVKLNTSELRLTGGHARFIPELYVGFNDAKKETTTSSSTETSTSKLQYIDNFLNLGFKLTQNFSMGVKGYFPNFGFKYTYPGQTKGGTKFNSTYNLDQKILGISVGATYHLGKGFFVGAFVNSDNEKRKAKANYLDFDNDTTVSSTDSDSDSFRRVGYGISYVRGNSRTSGFRAEASYSSMNVSKYDRAADYGSKKAEEIKAAIDIAWKKISFGGDLRMVKAGYYDQSDYIQRYFIEEPTTQEFTKVWGGFLSLNSDKGHSLGFSGYVLPSKGKRKFNGQEMDATSKTTMLNVNYAYLF